MRHTLEIVALEAQNSLDFLDEAFRLYESGTPFAICRPGTDLGDYPALQVSRRIAAPPRHGWSQPRLADPAQAGDAGDRDAPAQVVFSSGTEGKPKAIVLSRRALADVEDRLIAVMGLNSEIREYIGVPVTYSFGLGRARVVARLGGAFYLPERFDPVEIRDMLAAGQINAISAVPSLWRVLLARPDFFGADGARLRWIEIGSQYMSAQEKAALARMFPAARIVQHYGLTEASRSTFLTIDGQNDPERLESVGQPIGQTEIRITEEGAIAIRGPHLASGILGEDGSLLPVADAEGWLITRDRGAITAGWLYYRGRLDDQINLSGIKLASETLEREVAALVTLEDGHFALTSVADPLRGEVVLLAHDLQAAPHAGLLQAALLQVLAARGIQAAGQIRSLSLPELPRTGSGKIQRKALRALWQDQAASHAAPAEGGVAAAAEGGVSLSPAETRVAQAWRQVLGPAALAPSSGFYDLGGDSLAAMQIGLAMEQDFPRTVVRATLEGRSLADVARLLEAEDDPSQNAALAAPQTLPDRTLKTWAVNLVRGFMVISVVMSHWMPGVWARLTPDMANDPLALISRMGTPGFALVFGLGIACFMLDGYPGNQHSVRKRLKVSALFIFSAMLILAAIRQMVNHYEANPLNARSWGEAFYNVLAFYLLLVLSLPLWLKGLRGRTVMLAGLCLPLFWVLWLLAQALVGHEQWDSIAEWLRLMLVAKYSYFHMIPLVMAGILLGHWMMREADPMRFARQAMVAGTVIFTLGVLVVLETEPAGAMFDRLRGFWGGMRGTLIYIGFTTLALGAAVLLMEAWYRLPGLARLPAKGLILMGGLALPVYVFHELVIPLRDLLWLSGLSGKMALGLPMAAFLLAISYGMWRLHRMYFR